ncbi:MAG TPA: HNH endonuclease [Myxococcales bacterium]|nr:HNH endonuclease [Myxococcales bacterium]
MPEDLDLSSWVDVTADPAHVRREREKARQLRTSAWWQRRVSRGICAYCGGKFAARDVTMDHVVPLARGGRSTRGNVVVSCKPCNNRKKLLTPAEQLLFARAAAERASDAGEE